MINKPSEQITNFLNFITAAQSHYKFCEDEQKKQERYHEYRTYIPKILKESEKDV